MNVRRKIQAKLDQEMELLGDRKTASIARMLPDKDQTRDSPKEVTDGEEQQKNEHILALFKRLEKRLY